MEGTEHPFLSQMAELPPGLLATGNFFIQFNFVLTYTPGSQNPTPSPANSSEDPSAGPVEIILSTQVVEDRETDLRCFPGRT